MAEKLLNWRYAAITHSLTQLPYDHGHDDPLKDYVGDSQMPWCARLECGRSHSQKSWVILLMNIHKPNRVIYDVSK